MKPAGVSIKVTGLGQLDKNLRELGPKVYKRVMRKAVRAGAKPLVSATKSRAPNQTGTTKKSIGVVIRSYPAKETVIAVVGPKKETTAVVIAGHKVKKHVPANIAHLVEGGHRIVKGGKLKVSGKDRSKGINATGRVVGHVPPHPFLGPALETSKAAILNGLSDKMRQGITQEAAKLKKDGKGK